MQEMTREERANLELELVASRQEHSDLDAAIHALISTGTADTMMLQRLKKKKLLIKDRIIQLEDILLPDIIA